MNSGIPKQFLILGGKPMLMYSIEAFFQAFTEISLIVALPANQFTAWQNLCDQYAFSLPHQLISGGETRFHSVQHALSVIEGDGLVAIHDGARPMISVSLIRAAFLTAGEQGNCIPVIPVTESVRILTEDTHSLTLKREVLRIVQTPQVFQVSVIKKAYEQEYRVNFTDDATVAESIGETINLIDGDPVNLKITHPYDLAAAEILLKNQ